MTRRIAKRPNGTFWLFLTAGTPEEEVLLQRPYQDISWKIEQHCDAAVKEHYGEEYSLEGVKDSTSFPDHLVITIIHDSL